ncbi:MAG: Holliday junction resolvase RuvX [Candidatus Komeilibacteria bacterium]|nr:Holliday junction resolvase RuvX [Candidatus Komeilibacteria bacterium]
MRKYLGIDYGDVRIGLALADESNLALPFKIIDTDPKLWDTLEALLRSEGITDLVVGWPISMSGAENERTNKTGIFIAELERRFSLPVHKSDERLSTVAARKESSRARVDAQAAAHILQAYLDSHGPYNTV